MERETRDETRERRRQKNGRAGRKGHRVKRSEGETGQKKYTESEGVKKRKTWNALREENSLC